LDLPARRKNQNLIYTLPTSGGKVDAFDYVFFLLFCNKLFLDVSCWNYDAQLFTSSKSWCNFYSTIRCCCSRESKWWIFTESDVQWFEVFRFEVFSHLLMNLVREKSNSNS